MGKRLDSPLTVHAPISSALIICREEKSVDSQRMPRVGTLLRTIHSIMLKKRQDRSMSKLIIKARTTISLVITGLGRDSVYFPYHIKCVRGILYLVHTT